MAQARRRVARAAGVASGFDEEPVQRIAAELSRLESGLHRQQAAVVLPHREVTLPSWPPALIWTMQVQMHLTALTDAEAALHEVDAKLRARNATSDQREMALRALQDALLTALRSLDCYQADACPSDDRARMESVLESTRENLVERHRGVCAELLAFVPPVELLTHCLGLIKMDLETAENLTTETQAWLTSIEDITTDNRFASFGFHSPRLPSLLRNPPQPVRYHLLFPYLMDCTRSLLG